jgi:acetyl/propionyl-CoA carboxylase alpha subunit
MEIIENNTIRSKLPSGKIINATIIQLNEEILRVLIEEEVHLIRYFMSENRISIWSKHLGKFVFKVGSIDQRNVSSDQESKDFDGRIISSMPCKLNQIMVLPGDRVQINSPLCVTEAMKMEVLFNILMIKSYYF